jgi:hypothetical protein
MGLSMVMEDVSGCWWFGTARANKSHMLRATVDLRETFSWGVALLLRSFVFAVMIYSYYVVIGRLCAPMLQRRSDARGSVGEGGE